MTQPSLSKTGEKSFMSLVAHKFELSRSGRNAARLVLGFSDSSTRFPDGSQPDSHDSRFSSPVLTSGSE